MPKFDTKNFVKDNYTLVVTVRVPNLRWIKFRLRIAVGLCRLAAWIGDFGLQINQEVGVIVTDKEIKK